MCSLLLCASQWSIYHPSLLAYLVLVMHSTLSYRHFFSLVSHQTTWLLPVLPNSPPPLFFQGIWACLGHLAVCTRLSLSEGYVPFFSFSCFSSSSQCCSSGSWNWISRIVLFVSPTVGWSGVWCSCPVVFADLFWVTRFSLVFWLCVACIDGLALLFFGGLFFLVVR